MARVSLSLQQWEELARAANYNSAKLARSSNLSMRQLQREFRRVFQRSPQDWLNERRILAARELLLSGEPIKKIAFDLGFKQSSHFCRLFKSLNQMTPSEFILSETEKCRLGTTDVVGG